MTPDDIRTMRKAIQGAARGSRLDSDRFRPSLSLPHIARPCFIIAERDGLSGEDLMTMIAFHALKEVERLMDLQLERAMLTPAPSLVVVKGSDTK